MAKPTTGSEEGEEKKKERKKEKSNKIINILKEILSHKNIWGCTKYISVPKIEILYSYQTF